MALRSIKSAERTLALFELFSAKQRPLTVGEISRFLGVPQPSVTMLVQNLVALGYLDQDRYARTYTPTIRIALIGSWIHQTYVQDRQLEWRLSNLFNAVQETTFIGIQNGVHVQYILFIKAETPQRFDVQARMARPLATSAVGKALLSLKPDDVVRSLVHRANDEAVEPRHKMGPQQIIAEMEKVRRNGYAETCGDVLDDIAVIAMPIRPLLGQSPIAVAVGGQTDRMKSKKPLILEELKKFATALSADEDMRQSADLTAYGT
ncbi:IclR family transcriptional regulator [Rhizorhapis suberifaciens]|uniref:DNA-binding IclR family transcriptional regulator n=1 Tax=Rhizorhapis suberifaciens TaxID=13656 RepID=A0A840HXB9_9SPHN|nr:IclR family transcriptional regulator C-terminal domain-containing protein [Rhizorhapis suberifaciens]MBB4642209.1 DNA-binding IclR family transcriptional regulator [Rhizorhapis suberifaciens]